MTMTHAEKCLTFKRLHEQQIPFVMPNPWDAGSARILASAGFKALATTSAGVAFTLGRVDGTVSRDEALANARAILGATDLPVSADLENGYGDDPDTVAATMVLAFETGLAGASVEDASGDPADPIYPHDYAVTRVAAAVRAARSRPHPFTVTARAENFLHGRRDLDDVIRRLKAFVDVGADVVYAPGLPDIAAIRLVTSSVGRPVNVLVNAGLATTVVELGEAGVRRISLGGAVCRAAFGGLFRAAREMAERGSFGFLADAASIAEINACMTPKGRLEA